MKGRRRTRRRTKRGEEGSKEVRGEGRDQTVGTKSIKNKSRICQRIFSFFFGGTLLITSTYPVP